MKLTLGPLTIQLSGIDLQDIPCNARLFLDTTGNRPEADFCYTFHFVEQLTLPNDGWQMIFRRPDILVFQKEGLEARLLAIGNLNACYALYQERTPKEADIYFIGALKGELQTDTIFTSCLCLERQLAQRGCYILHCAFLDYGRQGILFSGRSGIGKSTHADLWCKQMKDARVINGDRALICPAEDGTYEACGWPVCGSSGICHNEKRKLKAIVFMDQAADNEVKAMTPMHHFKQLSSQVTINWWNAGFTREALDRLLTLANQTYICTYACNMQPEAAYTLHRHLAEKGIIC